MRLLVSYLAVTLLVTLGSPHSLAAGWLRLETPRFELCTDAGEAAGRRVLARLDQVSQAFIGLGGGRSDAAGQTRVYLLGSAEDFRRYRPTSSSGGFFVQGAGRDYVVLPAYSDELARVAVHEYIHLVLSRTSVDLPRWFEEGLAEYYSTVGTDDGRLVIGRPIDSRVEALRTHAWLSASEVWNPEDGDSYHRGATERGMFYAQSWALVHMLHLSPDYSGRMPRFAAIVAGGRPAREAFPEAFGRSFEQALSDLRRYAERGLWRIAEAGLHEESETRVTVTPLPEEEAERVRLDLELELGLWEVSAERLTRLAREDRETAGVAAARALIAMSRNDREAARAHFERAIELGSREAGTYYEYAMLLRESGGDGHEVRRLLERAIELNPGHAEAHFQLGMTSVRAGRHAEAIAPLRLAAELAPRRSHFWYELAMAHHQAGSREDARQAASLAAAAARSQHEREMAEAAVRLVTAESAWVELPGRPEVTTPGGWFRRQGDATVTGDLVRVDCQEEGARLHIRTGGETVVLRVGDPGAVLLSGVDSATFQFACGEQTPPRPVAVEYIPEQETGAAPAGVVTMITFR